MMPLNCKSYIPEDTKLLNPFSEDKLIVFYTVCTHLSYFLNSLLTLIQLNLLFLQVSQLANF